MNPELDGILKELYGMIFRLRVENEVNKTLLHSLKDAVLRECPSVTDDCLESIEFTSQVLEAQIRNDWSEEEAMYYRELIVQEKKKMSLLRPNCDSE